MDYEKLYKDALSRARNHKNNDGLTLEQYQTIDLLFPELRDSEDERIRKALIENFKWFCGDFPETAKWGKDDMLVKDIITWLEKQGEQKPIDKVEKKFHEGDFIIANDSSHIYQVMDVKRGIYIIKDLTDDVEYHIGIEEAHKSGRLWTIQDAKPGDVLATSAGAFIYNGNNGGGSCPGSYCGIDTLGRFKTGVEHHWTGKKIYPATKEQRDLLFQKMKEAGYEWDAEKKELKKTETKGGEK